MDAISFVLGLQARALRCHHMRDLIFRAKGEPATSRRRASVTLVYQLGRADAVEGMSAGDNVTFTRVISPSGQSTYRVNRQERSRDEYTKDLEGIGVIARGTNCLVAQGTVKDIGSRNPQAILELFEQVSGSADLKCVAQLGAVPGHASHAAPACEWLCPLTVVQRGVRRCQGC